MFEYIPVKGKDSKKIHIKKLGYMVWCVCSVVANSLQPMDCSCQVPLSMEFSRQEYWSGLPLSTPGDLSNPGIELLSLVSCVSCIGRQILYHCATFTIKKELSNTICSNTNGPRNYHTKWSEAKTDIWYHLYVESKKKDRNELVF